MYRNLRYFHEFNKNIGLSNLEPRVALYVIIPALGRLRQDQEFKVSLGYIGSSKADWGIKLDLVSKKANNNNLNWYYL
jgi:hypothetical protein